MKKDNDSNGGSGAVSHQLDTTEHENIQECQDESTDGENCHDSDKCKGGKEMARHHVCLSCADSLSCSDSILSDGMPLSAALTCNAFFVPREERWCSSSSMQARIRLDAGDSRGTGTRRLSCLTRTRRHGTGTRRHDSLSESARKHGYQQHTHRHSGAGGHDFQME